MPGAVYTKSGYDNAEGEDAICWSAPAFHNHTAVEDVLGDEHDHDDEHDEEELSSDNFDGINWHSDLVPSFVAGPTTMLASCPSGTSVHVDIIPEQIYGSYRLRTDRFYTYHVVGQVDLQGIRQAFDLDDSSFFYSSNGQHDVGLKIEFCPVNGNLCSPFVLEREESETLHGSVHTDGDAHGDGSHNHDEEGENHDEDHDQEREDHNDEEGEDHDGHDRRILKRRRVLHGKFRATQVVAFNFTLDDDGEDLGHDHEDDHDEEGENDAMDHDNDEEHLDEEGSGHADEGSNHTDEDLGGDEEHLDDADEEEHHEDEDHEDEDAKHTDEDGHGDEEGSDHHHEEEDEHEGHSLEVDEQQVKHLSSKLFLIPLEFTNETMFEFHLDVDIEVSVPGNYLPLASLQFFLSNTTIHGHAVGIDSEAAYKFDVANLLHQRAVFYYEDAYIQKVDLAIEILSYVLIGAAGFVQLACLCTTFYHRENQVIKLSQGSFLMLLQGAGIVATTCSFLYDPKSDAYCVLQSPMTLIPLQFMLAIVYGRLKRIIRIMEPLMNWNSPQSGRVVKRGLKAWKQSFMNGRSSGSFSSSREASSKASKDSKASSHSSTNGEEMAQEETPRRRAITSSWKPKAFCRSTNIRQQFTVRRLWFVVFLVTLPIVVVEIIGLALFRPDLTLEMNDDESIGRYECGDHREQTYHLASSAVLLLTIFFCLYEAQRSRRLPGLFNEAESVAFALLSSLFVGALGFAVILVSQGPSSDPNIPYIMEVIIVAYIATILVVRLTLPKLRLIWKGERVVIAKMITDHRKSQEATASISRPEMATSNGLSEISDSFRASSARESFDKIETGTSQNTMGPETNPDSPPPLRRVSETDKSVHFDASADKRGSDASVPSPPENSHTREPLIIRLGQEPPDRLMYRVLTHSNVMSKVNERVLSGLQVDRDGWEEVKASMDELHSLLGNVEYR